MSLTQPDLINRERLEYEIQLSLRTAKKLIKRAQTQQRVRWAWYDRRRQTCDSPTAHMTSLFISFGDE